MIKSPAEFIDAHGGAHQLARALGVKPVTVRMWKVRQRIPRGAWPEIMAAFPELTLDDLRGTEIAA